MFASDQYELVDFGGGRKLERFGPYWLDRPSIVAGDFSRRTPEVWNKAHARYVRLTNDDGDWQFNTKLPQHWTIRHEPFALEIKLTPFGHLGVFPEQAENWDWIGEQVRALVAADSSRRPKVLNLFAYTGGSTLAAAAAGAEVVHIDAAANVVAWARRNAELSGLADAPIRWIVEDARKFVDRECRRGNKYDMVIADPPAYGHGPKGEKWDLMRDLQAYGRAVAKLIHPQRCVVLFSHHSETLRAEDVLRSLRCIPSLDDKLDGPASTSADYSIGDMNLCDRSARKHHCGYYVRVVENR
jgi:23S rRNA (cytosine1962-C5)-methyltransferase